MVFLRLGLTSFGGPIAHLAYFRDELVIRRRWIGEAAYGELVGLCQFLPGPTSSQVGFALGLARAGPLGAVAAWTAFTLPSALLMLALGFGSSSLAGDMAERVFHGLKLVAIVVVAQAVWGMARTLTPDLPRIIIALAAGLVIAIVGGALGQGFAIVLGASMGLMVCRDVAITQDSGMAIMVSRRFALACLVLFAALLVVLPLLAAVVDWPSLQLFDIFYRAGALVFGGGHVVLPLLHADLVPTGLLTDDRFLTGYGAAQALPGPLFSIAAFLGAIVGNGAFGALAALVGIFVPGLLILAGALPFWAAVRTSPLARSIVAGVNAAVVGILALALYDPLWTVGVISWTDVLLVGAGLLALMRRRLPPIAVVALLLLASTLTMAFRV